MGLNIAGPKQVRLQAEQARVVNAVSPTAQVAANEDGALITIHDLNGTTTAQIYNGGTGPTGPQGPQGPAGAPGVGVPSGGTTGQVLKKKSGTDYDTEWGNEPSVPVTDVQMNGTTILNNGVANIPVMSTTLGVAKTNNAYGVAVMNDGYLRTYPPTDEEIKTSSGAYHVITPNVQHKSVFYALAKAAGDSSQASSSNAVGTYTEDAKSAISTMLNGAVSVSGSTPSITAKAGIRYICGECSTLDITTPASGIIDVVFESGSTPTVLTVTPPTGMTMKWANGFDPTSLESNTVYEINIMDGCLGVCGTWS